LVFIAGLLAFVHFRLQPKLDSLFIELRDDPARRDVGERIGRLRLYRKRFASVCLFCVLTMVMLGVQTWAAFDTWLTWVMLAAIAAFTYRTYRNGSPYGWA
jgi:1,4-dihydroxy-2-naphthoate octaprenyltransferase